MGQGHAEAAVSMPDCTNKMVSAVQTTYASLQQQLGVNVGGEQPPLSWVDKFGKPYTPTPNDNHNVIDQVPVAGSDITATTALTFTVQTSSR